MQVLPAFGTVVVMDDTRKVRGYLAAEVRIHCVRDATVEEAVERLRKSAEKAFGAAYLDDVEVEAIESAGLAFEDGGEEAEDG